jgi:hypothetical protein
MEQLDGQSQWFLDADEELPHGDLRPGGFSRGMEPLIRSTPVLDKGSRKGAGTILNSPTRQNTERAS